MARAETVNSELLTLTYGAIVSQLIRDYEDPLEVNVQLEQMGYNIGVRAVDEFCAKSRSMRCRNFKEAMDSLSKEALKMFLGVSAVVTDMAPEGNACTLRIPDNPLAGEEFLLAGLPASWRLMPFIYLYLAPLERPHMHHSLSFTLHPTPPRPQTLWSCPPP